MKKNNMLRIASVLLVAVLLSTCAISGAFAKYTASGEATDSARVAKFGFTVTGGGDNQAFGKMYNKGTDNGTVNTTAKQNDAGITVYSTTAVVAPGTKGTLATFTYGGVAEVDVAVTRSVVLDLADEKWLDKNGDFYCPLIISVGGTTIQMTGDIDTEAEFEAAVAAAVVASEEIKAGTELDETTLAITWEWPFSNGDAADINDTFLANSANFNGNTIELTASVAIDQID